MSFSTKWLKPVLYITWAVVVQGALRTNMSKQTFTEIRNKYPSTFLLLLDYEGLELSNGQIEVVAAEEARSFDTGEEMLIAYKQLSHSGKKVMFCTPEYKDRLIIDKLPAMRVFG